MLQTAAVEAMAVVIPEIVVEMEEMVEMVIKDDGDFSGE